MTGSSGAGFGSIRFRMAVVYSVVLFGLASLVLSVIYLGLAHSLSKQTVTRDVSGIGWTPRGVPFRFETQQVDQYLYIEREANARALQTLRRYTAGSLLVLFASSVGVGWLVAGRILRPIGHITDVARDIEATDLTRRIAMGGPDDELRQLADTFDGMLARLDEAFEDQREFIHEASHELRNPLAVMRTNLEVTLADPKATVEELRHAAEVAQRSAERMGRLVDDLLVYARRGVLSHHCAVLDASIMVREAVDEVQPLAAGSGITVDAQAVEGLWVDVDHMAMRQALGNLLVNALEASPPNSVVTVRGDLVEQWVRLSVDDQGHGVADEDRDRIFQRFWRADTNDQGGTKHSGLGLTIVRQVVEAHGGRVELGSRQGRGASFVIWLPVAPRPR